MKKGIPWLFNRLFLCLGRFEYRLHSSVRTLDKKGTLTGVAAFKVPYRDPGSLLPPQRFEFLSLPSSQVFCSTDDDCVREMSEI